MKLIADTHTHTLASTHAYSTVLENAKFASEIGLSYLGITDHAPGMTDAPHWWHFENLRVLPDELYGVKLLKGIEADLCGFSGELDVTNDQLSILSWVVASIHRQVMPKGNVEEITSAYIGAARNPYVDVIGHSGLAAYPYDYDAAIQEFARLGKLVEFNQGTFFSRPASAENCVRIALCCKKHGCRTVINSDAHFAYRIGQAPDVFRMLREIDFPKELVVNADLNRFEAYLAERKRRIDALT